MPQFYLYEIAHIYLVFENFGISRESVMYLVHNYCKCAYDIKKPNKLDDFIILAITTIIIHVIMLDNGKIQSPFSLIIQIKVGLDSLLFI